MSGIDAGGRCEVLDRSVGQLRKSRRGDPDSLEPCTVLIGFDVEPVTSRLAQDRDEVVTYSGELRTMLHGETLTKSHSVHT
jgi:hypothetical protein